MAQMNEPIGYVQAPVMMGEPSTARPLAGAAFEGVKGALKAWLGWVAAAGFVGMGVGILAAASATTVTVGSVVGLGAVGLAVGGGLALFTGTAIAATFALLGGAFGAAKGYAREREMQVQERMAPAVINHAYAQGAQHGAMQAASMIEEQMMRNNRADRAQRDLGQNWERPGDAVTANAALQTSKLAELSKAAEQNAGANR